MPSAKKHLYIVTKLTEFPILTLGHGHLFFVPILIVISVNIL